MAIAPQALAGKDERRLVPGEYNPNDEPRRTRRSTIDTTGFATDLPAHVMRPGWAYSWFPVSVYNEPVEAWQVTAVSDGGWEPTPASQILTDQERGAGTVLPRDWPHPFVERGGQRLYMRPQYLDDQSRADDRRRAATQSEGRLNQAKIDNPHVVQMTPPTSTFIEPGVRGIDTLTAEVETQREAARRSRAVQDPNGGPLSTSSDDIGAAERQEIASRHRDREGRVRL